MMRRDLQADLKICEAATPGPWAVTGKYVVQDRHDKDDFRQVIFKAQHIPKLAADMRFAAEARQGWPETIRYAMGLEEEIDRLREELMIFQEQLEQRGCGV
ncbi:hypothetical protein [Brevibacillus borstelensis]|uniref:hypothetical protein n=1 Tax=Brevibacillus borstelensis TaxID=45462 RepID=UPI0004F33173|nr:hypothetical protein [Brevibacillus borstelensis]KKX56364.1 hypothetical protein X546_04585 [Brevibacillus borstelensis cifa_chp40]